MNAWLTVLATLVAAVTSVRWLRIAQREHYLAGSVVRFALRWWRSTPLNMVVAGLALVGVVGVWLWPLLGWLGLVAGLGPLGLSMRGRTSKLAWTGRLRRLSGAAGALFGATLLIGLVTGRPGWTVATVVGSPLMVDLSLVLLSPIERRLGQRWVDQARSRLASSGARVVAITGSYGKTTTKGYLGHLIGGRFHASVSPASFNNRMGLARAINEHLVPGTEVFVAEMGTYGRGEITELCEFVTPEIGIITAIGPVHLERFGSLEAIVESKREILERSRVAVLNIDDDYLAKVADEETGRRQVVRISARAQHADVAVVGQVLRVGQREVASVGPEVFGANLAAAVAAALELGMTVAEIAPRLGDLPTTAHRRHVMTTDRGLVVVDDTYNSNPAGAVAALDVLQALPGSGRKVVVTPGMVELGKRQYDENLRLARSASTLATDLIVVGQTNRRALSEGAVGGRAAVTVVASREQAVDWVRSHLEPGDAVLYENDLPDHYP
ncbi:MAG: UDP-N-acetylmuramoyl-tripeptide--D-alanyl-D-alanine ligase [Acidimicrobiia bacterium]